ncbi:uncharacterized protein CC84DRAFT_410131 [Paraphaeosphaeria sporulosa]|uniref:Uncharacterized protein n=1 Tax=Paraphaeosphaeria sporulosa TaxID=1460663 RepID=A0A177BWQ3_9PLEO|nr:uncharacterized protein CC84DRAFT_410131 [Paraphaeosphaeria sporulosa]OAF98937.1 hypothetical protein CC84DRAFT_410131 [Paraphaeosphaeria sporulosa]
MQTCPVPDIDRALSPYIATREETLQVRRTLSKYLTASLRPVNSTTQNQHLDHESPHSLGAVGTNPPGLKGARGEYLEAIRSNKSARAKLERLQASLEDLQQRHIVEAPMNDSSQENDMVQGYIALLRQRRRFAEMELVQSSLEKLLNVNPIEGLKDPRDRVKDSLGEQPNLPAERLESLANSETCASSILKLKNEVLEARSSMDRAKAARSEVRSTSRDAPSLAVQVYALSCAREEIQDWIQVELSKMDEESGFVEDASPVKRPVALPHTQDLASSESQIRDCYNRYTASRADAVEGLHSLQQPLATRPENPDGPDHDRNIAIQKASSGHPKLLTASLLPHLSHLARSHTNERLMLLETVYLQNQMSSADETISDSLARLADESHLLPSGSRAIEPWGTVVNELEARNLESTQECLESSRANINNITTIVDLCSLHSKVLDSK